MMIWKKSHERHELCFVFCAGCTHFISLSFTIWQALDKASNFLAASSLCGYNTPKIIHAFCSQWLLFPLAECNNYNSLLPAGCRSTSLLHGSQSHDQFFLTILTSLPLPAAEKHPYSMMLPPPCFTIWMVPGFLQKWCLAFRSKSSFLVSSDQRILLFMVWESLFRCLLANSKWTQGKVLVVPNFFHLRMMEAIFWYPSPDLCLDTILSRSSTDNSFHLVA